MELLCILFCKTYYICGLLYRASWLLLVEFNDVVNANNTHWEKIKEKKEEDCFTLKVMSCKYIQTVGLHV